jgi:hypothetical protein
VAQTVTTATVWDSVKACIRPSSVDHPLKMQRTVEGFEGVTVQVLLHEGGEKEKSDQSALDGIELDMIGRHSRAVTLMVTECGTHGKVWVDSG